MQLIAFWIEKSWFEIYLLNLSAPLMALQDLRTNQRLKEVLQAIQGSFLAVFVELIGLRLFLIMMHTLGSPTNPGIAYLAQFPNLALPRGFFTLIMYLACFAAFLSGTSLVERWTGVPQSKSGSMLRTMAGVAIGAKALSLGVTGGKSAAKKIGLHKETGHDGGKEKAPTPIDDETGNGPHSTPDQASKATTEPEVPDPTQD